MRHGVGTKFYDECLNHEFNVMSSLKRVGEVKYIKTKLKPETIRKFYSVKGHYL